MKVAINKCYGGFGLSDEAQEMLISLGVPFFENWEALEKRDNEFYVVETGGMAFGKYANSFDDHDKRTDERLIKTIEALGKKANGMCANLVLVEIPDGIDFEIDDYDGVETIHEKHRSW